MSVEKHIGKIGNVKFGVGGYQDAMFGLTVELAGPKVNVVDFIGWWTNRNMEGDDAARVKATQRIENLCVEARVNSVMDLKNIPVEVTLKFNVLESWRILTEVM